MDKVQLMIGKLLLIGLLISLLFTIAGGVMFLIEHGQEKGYYQIYHKEPKELASTAQVWSEALTFTPLGMIQLGLLLLVVGQLARVALTAWFFSVTKEWIFVFLSLFILAVLIYTQINPTFHHVK